MSNAKKLKFDALDEKNYLVWIRRVKDHMFGKKLLDYYKHAMADDDAVATDVQLPAEDAAATAIKDKLEELWTFLNEHLTADIYKLTMDPDEVNYGDPVSLLVFLRKKWRSKTPFDRNILRDEFTNFNFADHKDMDVFLTNFKQHVRLMKEHNVGMVNEDEDVLYHLLNKVLPDAYSDHVKIIIATKLKLDDAYAYLKKSAKEDRTLPGSTNPQAATKRRDAAHAAIRRTRNASDTVNTATSEEICRNYAKGRCKFGAKCKFIHREKPTGSPNQERPKCTHCNKLGHLEEKCWKKHPELNPHKTSKNGALISIDDLAHAVLDNVNDKIGNDVAAAISTIKFHQVKSNELAMLIDGAATCTIIQDASKVANLRSANINIQVGGGVIKCNQVGDYHYYQAQDEGYVLNKTLARVVPGFGVDILPEAIYLAAGCAVNKLGANLTAKQAGKQLLTGHKLEGAWLYQATVTPVRPFSNKPLLSLLPYTNNQQQNSKRTALCACDIPDAAASAALGRAATSNALSSEIVLSCSPDFEAAFPSRSQTISDAELLNEHRRLAHRNFVDVCSVLGIPVPAKLPVCLDCIKGKSKRFPISTRDTPLYDAPRPGYGWACDHAGPFRTRTAGGNNILSLKVDIHSTYLKPALTNSTATFPAEWEEHVKKLEAMRGSERVVANLVTDSAPYYKDNKRLQIFNAQRGITHLFAPPYTQSLNGLSERNIYTVVELARTMLIGSGLPMMFYGEAIIYACYILNRLPYRAGAKLTRLDKYTGKINPNQLNRVHTFGCSAFVHLKHPTGPAVDKLEAKSTELVLVGYDEEQQSYRCVQLPRYARVKISISAHVTFVEDRFPAKLTKLQPDETADWLPEDWHHSDTRDEAPAPDAPRGAVEEKHDSEERPTRGWHPSAQALRNIAASSLDFDERPTTIYFESCFASTEITDVLTALRGPDKEKWCESIGKEHAQHKKHKTLGPPQPQPPEGVKAIPFEILLKTKRDKTAKARGVIKGFHMQVGLHFNETFSPVPNISTLKFLFAIAAQLDWEVKTGDVNTAFLAPKIDTDIWVRVPKYFNAKPTAADVGYDYRRVLKGIPGIPQGPRLFYRHISPVLIAQGLQQCKAEHTLFFNSEKQLYVVVWVDDLFFFFPSIAMSNATDLYTGLRGKLDLGEWEDIQDCLGCTVKRDRINKRLTLSQEQHARKIISKTGLPAEANTVDTPLVPGTKLTKKDCPNEDERAVMETERTWYMNILLSFIYLIAWTRVDLAEAVSKLCRFMHNPGKSHITALKRVVRYLAGTTTWGLSFDFSSSEPKTGVYGYYDAAHADCPDTFRSTLAYVFLFSGCPISWNTKLHSYITTSSNHSEYCAAAKAAKEAKWWHTLLTAIGLSRYVSPVDLFSDSKGAIAMTYNPVQRAASKHIDLADHYARECQERGIITVSHVKTEDMPADMLTKQLGKSAFLKHRDFLMADVV